ncbi:hypothetical protein LINPERHAP1_LOCUS28101 [Linum perenne]
MLISYLQSVLVCLPLLGNLLSAVPRTLTLCSMTWQLPTCPMVLSSLGQLSRSRWLSRRLRGPSLLS